MAGIHKSAMRAIFSSLIFLISGPVYGDGSFFSTESIALSADQRAIIIQDGPFLITTFSTGYTGDGSDFAWLIPTPVPPLIEDVWESGETAEEAFRLLDEKSAPRFFTDSSGGLTGSDSEPASLVTVYGRATLEHYDITILGAEGGAPLLSWLKNEGYAVGIDAEKVLDTYLAKGWTFTAVKMRPKELRPYINDFLPPLTIKILYDKIIFPLYISSISTEESAGITLYIIARSTVSAADSGSVFYQGKRIFPGTEAKFKELIEGNIRLLTEGGAVTVILYKDTFDIYVEMLPLFSREKSRSTAGWYLTRMESRFNPEAPLPDLEFIPDTENSYFRVNQMSRKARISDLLFLAYLIVMFSSPLFLLFFVIRFIVKVIRSYRRFNRDD